MRFRKGRFVQPELLDDQTPEEAAPSLRDIIRINQLAGGHRVLLESLSRIIGVDERFTMLDVGAASGDAAAVVRRKWPQARVVSLDYRSHHLREATGDRVTADAFRLPFRERSFDVVYCGLFLHHFEDDAVVKLLRSFGQIASRFVVVNDLERHALAYYFLPATKWLFGWHPLTLHDGPISVQAAFVKKELITLAVNAGLCNSVVSVYRPAFRLALISEPSPPCDDTLGK